MRELPPDLGAGNEAAWRQYADLVRGVGQRHGLDPMDLDEVMQEVRIRLWRALGHGERIGAVRPLYIRRTAVSAAIDVLRRRRLRREQPVAADEEPSPLPPTPDTPERRAERGEFRRRLGQAIEALAPSRQPVVRMYLAGYSSGEIAEVFGWTEAKARNLLYRGLDDLRARLTALGCHPEALA